MIHNVTYVSDKDEVFEIELSPPRVSPGPGVIEALVEHTASGHQRYLCLYYHLSLDDDDFDAQHFVDTVVAERIAGIRW